MYNQPLSASDHSMILIFSLLMIPSLFYLFGIIPAIFLGFGIFMMKKNKDFSSIDTAVKNFKIYMWIMLIACIFISLFWGYMLLIESHFYDYNYENNLVKSLFFTCIAIFYLISIQSLFYSPTNNHREWIEINGFFSTKPKQAELKKINSETHSIKSENPNIYSSADELIKWVKLKDDGHISEEEFNKAKAKILKIN